MNRTSLLTSAVTRSAQQPMTVSRVNCVICVPSPGTPQVPGHDGRGQEDHGHTDDGARARKAEDGPGGREDEGRRHWRGYLMSYEVISYGKCMLIVQKVAMHCRRYSNT